MITRVLYIVRMVRTSMQADDVMEMLDLALATKGIDRVRVVQPDRLNGTSKDIICKCFSDKRFEYFAQLFHFLIPL